MTPEPRAVAHRLVDAALGTPGAAPEDGFRFVALDWEQLKRDGLPEVEYLDEPYLPTRARIWGSGPTESAKSMWAMWKCAQLSRQGFDVAYVSMENPLVEDIRRLERLRPDWEHFAFYHHELQPGVFDLVMPEHVEELIRIATGQALTVLDTFTGCWSGDENSNREFNSFDLHVMRRTVDATGSSLLVTDHTGHPQQFNPREGAAAARGASSKGQKCDAFLQFKAKGDKTFEITHGKARLGGQKAGKALLKVIDTDDGGLDIVKADASEAPAIREAMDAMVAAVEDSPEGFLTSADLKAAVRAGSDNKADAMRGLLEEKPARLVCLTETIRRTDKNGKASNRKCSVWRLAGTTLLTSEAGNG